jgi:hypothetical protein
MKSKRERQLKAALEAAWELIDFLHAKTGTPEPHLVPAWSRLSKLATNLYDRAMDAP